MMEEIREAKIAEILTWLQATARGKMARMAYKKMQNQKVHIMQYNSIITKGSTGKLYVAQPFFSFIAGFVLRAEDHSQFHCWQDLALVAALAGHQT